MLKEIGEGQTAVKGLLNEIRQKKLDDEVREKERRLGQEEIDELHRWADDTLRRYGDSPLPCVRTQPVEMESGKIFLRRVEGEFDLGDGPDHFSRIEIVYECEEEEGTSTTPMVIFERDFIKNGAGKVLGSHEERDPIRSILALLVSKYYDPRKRT